jgi:hypothetical protein
MSVDAIKRALAAKEIPELERGVESLIEKFRDYESEVATMKAKSLLVDVEIARASEAVKSLTKAVEMVRTIVHADASPEEKIKLLKAALND